MILFCLLAVVLTVIIAAAVAVLGLTGGVMAVIFSDLIVCAVLLVMCIKRKKK